VALTGLVASPCGALADAPRDRYLEQLSADRGCPVCHAMRPPPAGTASILPVAPSWQDIARRYRATPGAEDRLVALVVTGSDPNDRHWKGHAEFDRMLPNEIATSPDEARKLVRWILSF
jgi:cytochrome c551/c552